MVGKMRTALVCRTLNERKGNIRCQEIKRLLENLGFFVKDGKRGGHKVFTHDGLAGFISQSFNCGHGKNPEIKKPYIAKIVDLLKEREKDLDEYLGFSEK